MSPSLSFIIHKYEVSLLHGLIVASLRINKIYIKMDKVKIKPNLHQSNHCISSISLFVDCSNLQKQPNSSQCHILYLDLFCLRDKGYRTQYFTYLSRHSCLYLRIHHGGSCMKPSNCCDKIKMPTSTTGSRIKSFIPVENTNVEKLIDT